MLKGLWLRLKAQEHVNVFYFILQEDLTISVLFLLYRCQNQEEDFQKRELLLQQDLDHASFNESKLSEKCEDLEQLYHNTRRKKDEQNFELKQCQERVKVLEEELNEVEDQKARLEDSMNEMQHILKKYVYEEENMASSPRYSPKLGNSNKVERTILSEFNTMTFTKKNLVEGAMCKIYVTENLEK